MVRWPVHIPPRREPSVDGRGRRHSTRVFVNQGRIFPLVGPAVVLYLIAEVAATGTDLDGMAVALCVLGLAASAVPLWMRRVTEERTGARRVGLLGVATGVTLVAWAVPGLSSLYLDVAGALAPPLAGALAVDLALDTPDRPAALVRRRALVRALLGSGAAASAVALLADAPVFVLFERTVLVPPRWRLAAPAFAVSALAVALALRLSRRRLGSTPEALAAGGWAQLGLATALGSAAAVGALAAAGTVPAASPLLRGGLAVGALALPVGHVAMLGARRQVRAGRNARRLLAGTAAVGLVSVGAALLADRLPRDPVAVGAGLAFATVLAALAFRVAAALVRRALSPFGGRLLDGARAALDEAVSATSLEEVGAAVLPHLRRASDDPEAAPLLFTLDPPREVRVDAASTAHVEERELSPVLRGTLSERPGEVVVSAPLAEQVVRRADLRPLVDALDRLDALCVVPLAVDLELEGALVVPRGRRRAALTLEEIDALERLGRHLSAQVSMLAGHERARRRTRDAVVARERLEERLEAAQEELAKLRADTRILKAGGAAERFAQPAIAYSPAMRALTKRVQEVGPLDAPVLLLGEEGSALDRAGHLVHAAGGRRDGPFVVADCAAVRPERADAALFGEANPKFPGWLRLADGGTCLLLDVPALSLDAQAKLAEALATRRAPLADGAGAYPVDARIVATSRVPLGPLTEAGTFDPELAKRLSPAVLDVPPLRQRREDLPSLVLLALDRACRTTGRPVVGIDPDALEVLVEHDWPGNLRELDSVIDRAVAKARGPNVTLSDLPPLAPAEPGEDPWDLPYAEIEHRVLARAMKRARGNKSEAARLLGLKRTTFLDKLKRHGLHEPSKKKASKKQGNAA